MKVLFAASSSAALALAATNSRVISEDSLRTEFATFVEKFGRTYSGEEYENRFNIFTENVALINSLNLENPEADFGITEFTDQTHIERTKALQQGFRLDLPEGFDGSNVGSSDESKLNEKQVSFEKCYTSARNQGSCGSCWAFSTTSAIQGALCKATDSVLSELSPQQLVDCDEQQAGCNGASTLYEPFDYAAHNGVCTESAYPYLGRSGSCNVTSCQEKFTIAGYKDVSGLGVEALVNAVDELGPLSVGVDASISIQFYLGGVLNKLACTLQNNVNHAVTLVGYEKKKDKDTVFKIMNSWGSGWGKKGHFLIKHGACGFGSIAVGAVVNQEAIERI